MALDNTTNPAMDEGKPATNFSENGDNSNSVNPAENNNNTEGSADTSFANNDDHNKNDDNSKDDDKNAIKKQSVTSKAQILFEKLKATNPDLCEDEVTRNWIAIIHDI